MDATILVSAINPDELSAWAPPLSAWKRGLLTSEDEVAEFMVQGGPTSPTAYAGGPPSGGDPRPDRKYWDFVREEMHVFLCKDDKRYKDLWKSIGALQKQSTAAIVGLIAAYLGGLASAPATLLAGFVAVCLYGAAKIGKEAYCRLAAQR
ncbi:MAG: hypothetical protein ABWY05_15165 [Noviherbaspirillum sp.]